MQAPGNHIATLCRQCGKPVRGRADKVFCDANCKNDYHNFHQRKERILVEGIDRVLKRNRLILKTLLGEVGEKKVSKQFLLQQRFHFHYHTEHYTNIWREKYCFCYEYGYLLLGNNEFLLFKKDDFSNSDVLR